MTNRPPSIILGRDNDVLSQMLEFYKRPDGLIVDVTCNERRMWKGIDIERIDCDIDASMNPDVCCDFSKTPFENESVSLIVFDPPHLPAAAGSPKSLEPFVKRYGFKTTELKNNISDLFFPFLIEAYRILKEDGLIFAKLSDYVHNHKYQWMMVEFINKVNSVPGLTPTDLIIKKDPSAGNLSSGRWVNSYHSRNSHAYWVVVRKGGCEPKKEGRLI